MSKRNTILSAFESLPELETGRETGSPRVRAGVQKKIEQILSLEGVFSSIMVALDMQRIMRDTHGNTKDIRPISDGAREEYMARLPHTIPYFAQRAFSLPIDYRIPKDRILTEEAYVEFLKDIVIDPEYLSDDLLVSLHLMREDEKKSLSIDEKIERKRSAIPIIKNLLLGLSPLKMGEKRTSGRISQVTNPKSPYFGGYLVFQEFSEIEEDREKKRRAMRRKVVPHFYKDHYSLIRSQRYAKLGLEKKLEFLREMRDDIFPALIIRWQRKDYGEERKRQDIALIEEELRGKTSYHERRAREDRIQKIQFQNPEQDRLRLLGACNDMIRAIEEKIGKNNEITAQTAWLRDSESQIRSTFELFYEEVMLHIPAMNQALHGVDPRQMHEKENLRGDQTHEFNSFLRVIARFHERIGTFPTIGNPFHTLPGLIRDYQEKMKAHRLPRKGALGKEGIRLTLQFILELKRIRFEIMMKEAEYRIKVRGEAMGAKEKDRLKAKVETVRDSLTMIHFLPEIKLRTLGQKRFEDMIGHLEQVIGSLS